MKRGHVPLRTCRVCRRKAPKQELARLVVQQGCLVEDERQVAPGHGVYCCRDGACRERLGKKLGKTHKKSHLLRCDITRTGVSNEQGPHL